MLISFRKVGLKMNELIITQVAENLKITKKQVENVLEMLASGNTVPFIARYRKEVTKGLNEDQIREISKVYEYEVSLLKRKEDVIRLIDEKGLLSEELKNDIVLANKLSEVEDLYRPFKEKKKTRATIAKAKGLEPLANWILQLPKEGDLQIEAKRYINDEITNEQEAIAGALDIIAEVVSDNPKFRKHIKNVIANSGIIVTKEKKKHADEKKTYQMYYEYQEPIHRIVSHRILAINRAEREKVISVSIEADVERLLQFMYNSITQKESSIVEQQLYSAIQEGYKRLIEPSVHREIRSELTEIAENQALSVFSINLEKLLLQAPLKDKMILGLDPAYRTGCKLAVVDPTGKVLKIDKIYPTIPKQDYSLDIKKVLHLIQEYQIDIIAIGNGTASRESEAFIAKLIKDHKLDVSFAIISEAGASVYSASKIAKEEFPEYQVEERSAVSIARRLQDPLAELVKIEPKAISVGQYQHDMNQKKLEEQLDFVVMKTVNNVGVNINTASSSLLQYVSGLTKATAKSIVNYRNELGRFPSRKEILSVPKLGDKTYQQAVGFLRIPSSEEPLDSTAIHPESYEATYRLLELLNLAIKDIETKEFKETLKRQDSTLLSEKLAIDMYTLNDIIDSLCSFNRSLRDDYDTPILRQDVLKIEDLKGGMQLQGTVRNVVDFGAFIDIGIKQDGLVHISKISKERINHPLDKLNVGDIVQVSVLEVDIEKKRIALTMV